MFKAALGLLTEFLRFGTQCAPGESDEPLCRNSAFEIVPGETDRLFNEAERKTIELSPLRLLDLPVL